MVLLNPENNGINYQPQLVSLRDFWLPSTISGDHFFQGFSKFSQSEMWHLGRHLDVWNVVLFWWWLKNFFKDFFLGSIMLWKVPTFFFNKNKYSFIATCFRQNHWRLTALWRAQLDRFEAGFNLLYSVFILIGVAGLSHVLFFLARRGLLRISHLEILERNYVRSEWLPSCVQ